MDLATSQAVCNLEHRAQEAANRHATATINGRTVGVRLNAPGSRYGARWTVDGVRMGYSAMRTAVTLHAKPAPAVPSYIETRIDACGRRFGIRVLNAAFPFQVGRLTGNGDEFEPIGPTMRNRSDAIEACALLAIRFIRGQS